jgi:hypothetical protein|tara:strand:+ start:11039 stop:11917 length:879 start_codon:yes stop_codon:yes gene_type:complete
MEQTEQSNAEAQVDNRVDGAFMYENPTADTIQPEPTITQTTRVQNQEVPQTEEANPVAEVQPEVSAKDDPNRIAYWQSQTDKAKNDAAILAEEANKYKQALEQVRQSSVSNESQNRLRSDSIEEPIKPERPISYNEVDAYNDPESDSFKYRIQYDKYRDARLDYVERLEYARQKQQQAQFAKQQERQMVNQAYTQVQNAYGFDQVKAADFIGWAQDPKNITMDSLVKLYNIQKSPGIKQQQVEQKKQAIQNQNEALKVPTTTAVAPGTSQPQMDDEAMFNEALLSKSYKRRK